MLSQLKALTRQLFGDVLVSRPAIIGDVEETDAHRTAKAAANLQSGKDALERGELAAAFDPFQRVIDSGMFTSEGHYGWALAALRLGRIAEGADGMRRALNGETPHPEAALRLAELTILDNNAAAALELYDRALEIAPNLAEAHLGWGKAAARLGREGEALDAFRRAFELNPQYAEAGLRYAEWTLARGDALGALQIYRKALDVAPDFAEAEYGYGVAALEVGKATEAEEAFSRAKAINPGYPAANTAAAFLSIFPPGRLRGRAKPQRQLICLPILPFLRGWLGGQIYLLNFARIMSTLPKSKRPRLVVVLMDDWRESPSLSEVLAGLLQCDAVVGIFEAGLPVSLKPLLDRYFGAGGGNDTSDSRRRKLFASVDWTFPLLYPSWGLATVPRPIFWIPDFQHRFLPSYFKAEELVSRDRDIMALAARDVPVIFSSHDAESHFHQFHPVRRNRSHVWHFYAAPDSVPAISDPEQFASLNLPRRFYYTPNQFWPHKNHETLFRGLRQLLDQGHDLTFVCTGSELGSESDDYQRGLLSLIDELDLGRNLRLLGILPRPVQLELYRRACAIIQPSLFEGWSTVIEDVRAIGRPLIVSDIPIHREQADADTIFFGAQNHASLAAAVAGVDGRIAPGPDLDREKAAREALQQHVAGSAQRFLDILASERLRP